MGHDQLFIKDFLRAFFQEFIELFSPEVSARLNFETLRFLDKELFTDFPEGSLREADVVAEIRTHDGKLELILVHIEVQLRSKPDFGLRMLQYYMLLWLRYQNPIYPVAVYLKGGGEGIGIEQYSMNLFGLEPLRFRCRSLRLAKLDAREYVGKSNPVGGEKGREEGLEAGLKAGLVKGKRETLRQLLTKKFGPFPETAVSRLEALESLEDLDGYLDRVLAATSLDEMGLES